jgi:GxxExxY protein
MNINDITGQVIRSAIKVHSALGPGLLESAYRVCLHHDLTTNGLRVVSETVLPVSFDGVRIDAGYRIDLLVEDSVIVELKIVRRLLPVHEAQILSYLRLSNLKVGLLINFNVWRLADGIKRMVNRFDDERRSDPLRSRRSLR